MAGVLHPIWPNHVVIAVADVLGDTSLGLTGSEIGRVLARVRVPDVDASATKRHRLANALLSKQASDGASNCVILFITEAMAIGNYLRDPDRFELLRTELDPALSLVGVHISDRGQVARSKTKAATLDEVAALTGRMLKEMERRKVHPMVLEYCREELLRKSIFHAVSEATKGICDRLRQMTGSTLDGSELVNACFTTKERRPPVRINDFESQSDASEHNGFANMLRGVIGTFRNTTAHATRASWPVSETDALDVFSTLSLLHRRLDDARVRRIGAE